MMQMNYANARRTFYTLAAAALFLSGCGGGGDSMESTNTSSEAPAEAEPRVDLCALLTNEDIEEALGASAGQAQPGDEELGQCAWTAADGSGVLVALTLEDALLGSFDEFVEAFGVEFGGENPPRDEYHPVDGVPGDWAMYVADEHMVRAFRGEHVLEVSAPAAEEVQVIDLAARAMGRLP